MANAARDEEHSEHAEEPAPQEELTCAVCGHPIAQDDIVCLNCGVSLAAG